MRLFAYRIGGQIMVVRAASPEEAARVLRGAYPDSDLTDGELERGLVAELSADGPAGVVLDVTG